MIDPAHIPNLVTGLAFALAFVFGAVAQRVNFCTMGAISDIVNIGDWGRMRMWMLAIAVAILGTALLQAAGQIDTAKTYYTGASVPWLSHIVGGILFGIGMTLGSGCGSKTLIRTGAGNLKSLIVLVFLGISAYMTLKGAFALWRANGLDVFRWNVKAATSDLPTLGIGGRILEPNPPLAAAGHDRAARDLGVREPRFPSQPRLHHRRAGHRRRHRRRLVRVGAPRLPAGGSEHA